MRCPTLDELPPSSKGRTDWPWTEESQQLPALMPDGRAWPLVCIVTPSYNQADYLEETIRSVLLQGYPNLEYIVVDGKSIDSSQDIIHKYERWLTHWVIEPDSGQSDAINKGWRLGKGEIVAWINSDDLYCTNTLKTVADSFAGNPEVGLVHGDCICVNSSGVELGVLSSGPVVVRRLLTGRNTLLQPSTFFKRSLLNQTGVLDTQLHYVMDYDLWVRMLVAGSVTKYIPFPLSKYRLHRNAKTVRDEFQMKAEVKKVLDRMYENRSSSDIFQKWKKTAYSNYHWSIGEAYMKDRQLDLARREFWMAIRLQPLRPATLILLAFLLDTSLGTQLGSLLHELQWQVSRASKNNILWDELMKDSWK